MPPHTTQVVRILNHHVVLVGRRLGSFRPLFGALRSWLSKREHAIGVFSYLLSSLYLCFRLENARSWAEDSEGKF